MVDKTNSYDVIIVGGGPAGSQVAYKLAGNGYRVGVIERKKNLDGAVCCTGLVSHECVNKYSIPEGVIYRWANSAMLCSPSGKAIRVQRDNPQVAVLNRTAFNQAWAERAQKSGAEYLFGSDVKSIEHEKNKVKLDIYKHGEPTTLQSRAVIIAAGFGAQLMDSLNLGGASDFVMGAQAEVSVEDVNEVEIYFGSKTAPGFFAWVVPTLPGKALVGLLSRRDSPSYLRKLITSLTSEGKIIPGEFKMTHGGVPIKPLPHTYRDNVLVIGTAAGQVKPITGGGIYFGMICADIAANTLHRALQSDKLSSEALSGYERGWQRKLSRELRTGYWARKAYEMLSDRQVDRIFNLFESTGIIDELSEAEELSFDWHADVITRLMGQKLFARAIDGIKKPFERGEKQAKVKKK